MSWDNHGEVWEIDHKYPLNKFRPDTPINIVNALDNLEPLLVNENRQKLNRV